MIGVPETVHRNLAFLPTKVVIGSGLVRNVGGNASVKQRGLMLSRGQEQSHICQGQRARETSLSLDTLKQKKPAVNEIRGFKDDKFWLLVLYFFSLCIVPELEGILNLWSNVQTKGK